MVNYRKREKKNGRAGIIGGGEFSGQLLYQISKKGDDRQFKKKNWERKKKKPTQIL